MLIFLPRLAYFLMPRRFSLSPLQVVRAPLSLMPSPPDVCLRCLLCLMPLLSLLRLYAAGAESRLPLYEDYFRLHMFSPPARL